MSAMTSARVKKVMTQPINLIFRFLQNRTRIQIWLYEQTSMRIEVTSHTPRRCPRDTGGAPVALRSAPLACLARH